MYKRGRRRDRYRAIRFSEKFEGYYTATASKIRAKLSVVVDKSTHPLLILDGEPGNPRAFDQHRAE
jgi:hypothetical protein